MLTDGAWRDHTDGRLDALNANLAGLTAAVVAANTQWASDLATQNARRDADLVVLGVDWGNRVDALIAARIGDLRQADGSIQPLSEHLSALVVAQRNGFAADVTALVTAARDAVTAHMDALMAAQVGVPAGAPSLRDTMESAMTILLNLNAFLMGDWPGFTGEFQNLRGIVDALIDAIRESTGDTNRDSARMEAQLSGQRLEINNSFADIVRRLGIINGFMQSVANGFNYDGPLAQRLGVAPAIGPPGGGGAPPGGGTGAAAGAPPGGGTGAAAGAP